MKPISQEERISHLQLIRSQNVGVSTFFRLINIFKSADEALKHLHDFSVRGGNYREITPFSREDAKKELEETEKFGGKILLFDDENYPRLLRQIADPPPLFTIKGNESFLNRDTIAIVGSRNSSFNGNAFAKKLAFDLGQQSLIIASGMAKGIDAAAHAAAITTGTIGVIGGGIDNIYPFENRKLYQEVIENGLLISEMPFGSPPKGVNFVQRNRIISGLSMALIVVEAGFRSGSLITAKFAGEQGREIFSVPGSPLDPRNFGSNRLIKEGANMLESVNDVLFELPNLKARFSDSAILQAPHQEEFIFPAPRIPSAVESNEIRAEILQKLNFNPVAIEDIMEEMQLSATQINIALAELELAGRIEVVFGRVYLKSN